MPRRLYSFAALATAFVTGTSAQSSSVNPLNQFISIAGSAVTAVESHVATQTPASTSTSPTSTAASSTSATSAASSTAAAAAAAAAAPAYNNNNNLNIIIPVVVVVGLLLLAALALCLFCCLRRRRRRRRVATPVEEEEVSTWRRPSHPGQAYSPVRGSNPVPMSQQPTIPLMAATHHDHDHPAYRAENRVENPFVPVPPQPRKTAPNACAGLTDGMVAGAPAFIEDPYHNGGHLRRSNSFSRNRSSSGVSDLSYRNEYGDSGHDHVSGIYPVPVNGRGSGHGHSIPAYDRNSYGHGHSPVRKPVPVSAALQPTYPGLTASSGLHSNPHNSPDGPYAAVPRSPHASVDSRIDHRFSTVPTTGGPTPAHMPYPITTSWPAHDGTPATAHPTASSRPRSHSPYRSVGSPLHAHHLSQLSTSPPSTDLHRTDRDIPAPIHPATFETVPAPAAFAEIPHPTSAQTRRSAQRPGFTTPPLVPSSRSPNRRSVFGDSTYESGPSHHGSYGSASASASGESGMPQPPVAPWEDRERRYSGGSAGRRYSGSAQGGTSPGGTPTGGRRLRFSDLPREKEEGEGAWRVSGGVGEAL